MAVPCTSLPAQNLVLYSPLPTPNQLLVKITSLLALEHISSVIMCFGEEHATKDTFQSFYFVYDKYLFLISEE